MQSGVEKASVVILCYSVLSGVLMSVPYGLLYGAESACSAVVLNIVVGPVVILVAIAVMERVEGE